MFFLWISFWRNLLFQKVAKVAKIQVFATEIVLMVATYLFYLLSLLEFGPRGECGILVRRSVPISLQNCFLWWVKFVIYFLNTVMLTAYFHAMITSGLFLGFLFVLFYFIVFHTECISIFKLHASCYFLSIKKFRRLNNR